MGPDTVVAQAQVPELLEPLGRPTGAPEGLEQPSKLAGCRALSSAPKPMLPTRVR